jgi:hypothetical protein
VCTWLAAVALLSGPADAAAQVRWVDLVVSAGVSGEGYRGNLSSATVPVVDSTDQAQAAVGDLGVQGSVLLLERPASLVQASFDLGVRQFAASGFQVRDYSPREWAGVAGLLYRQRLGGAGTLFLRAGYQGRSVDDRPPMPLFLQPAFHRFDGSVRYVLPALEGVQFDISGRLERSDYQPPRAVTQLDLLDRDAAELELGARWGVGLDVRFYAGLRQSEYPLQGSFDPADPYRRDRTVTVGAEWAWVATVAGTVGLEGIVNRSNSRRPEYDAFALRTELVAPLPWGLTANLYGVLTGKTYVFSTPFARLVPGEEADAASVLYVELARDLAPNLASAVRFGWTRAETDIGESYYERYGVSLLLRYRPHIR